jgi:murein DD-endopeptidase MepM/ murein hydrolase activator NlpD
MGMLYGTTRFTILFIPDDHGRTVSITLSATLVRSLIALLVLFILGAGFLVWSAGAIALKLQAARHLSKDNELLRAENGKLEDVRNKIRRIEEMNAYIEQLAVQTNPVVVKKPDLPVASMAAPETTRQADSGAEVLSEGGVAPSTAAQPRGEYGELALRAVPFIRPVRGWVTREFAVDAADPGGQHRGVDIAAAEGTIIQATAPGVVEDVTSDEFLGKTLALRHSFGFETRYGHCAQILVSKGDHVLRGQTVALVGNTGRSSAPHLHYEVLRGGRQVDPQRYMID